MTENIFRVKSPTRWQSRPDRRGYFPSVLWPYCFDESQGLCRDLSTDLCMQILCCGWHGLQELFFMRRRSRQCNWIEWLGVHNVGRLWMFWQIKKIMIMISDYVLRICAVEFCIAHLGEVLVLEYLKTLRTGWGCQRKPQIDSDFPGGMPPCAKAIQIWELQEDPARCEEFWESSHKVHHAP